MGPDHFSPVARAPQGLAQVRIVEHVPEPIYHVPISPRLIGNHLLDRSQGKREKCVATAFQRRPYGLRTDEFVEPHFFSATCGLAFGYDVAAMARAVDFAFG